MRNPQTVLEDIVGNIEQALSMAKRELNSVSRQLERADKRIADAGLKNEAAKTEREIEFGKITIDRHTIIAASTQTNSATRALDHLSGFLSK